MTGMILSAGMIKAGSAWFFNMTTDLAVAEGWDDARTIRRRFGLRALMTEVNVNIGRPGLLRFLLASYPALLFSKRYVLKTHYDPSPVVRYFLNSGRLKATYIYRDPRDVIVSTMDHSRRVRGRGISSAFSPYDTFEKALPLVKENARRWQAWAQTEGALLVRYEDLLQDPDHEIERLCDYLQFNTPEEKRREIVARYSAGNNEQQNLHFHKGIAGRYRQSLSEMQIAAIEQEMGEYITAMGYPLTREMEA